MYFSKLKWKLDSYNGKWAWKCSKIGFKLLFRNFTLMTNLKSIKSDDYLTLNDFYQWATNFYEFNEDDYQNF